jgi:hypothetical protein
MSEESIRKLAGSLATEIGNVLRQTYKYRNGKWWLFTAGRPMRELSQDEVEWHTRRKHFPFVANGITKDDPRWWDEPEAEE